MQLNVSPTSIKQQAYFTTAWLCILIAIKNLLILAPDYFASTLITDVLVWIAAYIPILIYVMITWIVICVFLYAILMLNPQKEDPEYW